MRKVRSHLFIWLLLGIVVGLSAASLIPALRFPNLALRLPEAAQDVPGFAEIDSPTPTATAAPAPTPIPEPKIPCQDSRDRVAPPAYGPQGAPANYLHTCAGSLYDARGNRAQLTGVNWYGMESKAFAPGGLMVRNWQLVLDQISFMGFNSIRLAFTNEALRPDARPKDIDYELNPDLVGLVPLEIMDRVVAGARQRGLKVILDRHRPVSTASSSLWYTQAVPEDQWIADWRMLAQRYLGNDTIIGFDLHNEPNEMATWGSGEPSTDWRMAAEKAGNAILEENPHLLIFVEGIYQYDDYYWYGGNLKGVRDAPVNLTIPNRVVYSPHEFGPGVYYQPWFDDPTFPTNLGTIWDAHWGYIAKEGIAPVVVGEWGGRSVGNDKEGLYQRRFIEYMEENGVGYLYWALNPDSPDSGGLLAPDWVTPLEDKLQMLSRYQSALLGRAEAKAP